MKTGFRVRAPKKVVAGAVAALFAVAIAAIGWPSVQLVVSRWYHGRIDFSRDIRPIFNQYCVACHGGVRQKNGVSFIFREEALGKGKSGRQTIVPGHPDSSELILRVTAKDPDVRMPYHAPELTPEQIALLRRWIAEGARWSDYWAFVPPKPQPFPVVKRSEWVRQPLDRFILARLEHEALLPSPEAEKAELLRRVSLDLTGLPPTLDEQTAYLADNSENAYEKQVDRLLSSSAYGERWASMWLDLARYADSMGYEADRKRPGVWAYRDWVIDAYNQNLPYDQFVIKQLAGDLLPRRTFQDRIATAFHRLTPNNQEGGTDDEEFRLVAAMDRVATTWSVLNGVTMNCVQCHSHPYDPIRHPDYYKSLAFFDTSNDADRDDDYPTLRFPKDRSCLPEAEALQQEISALVHQLTISDREAVENGQWSPLPVESAAANEVMALVPRLREHKAFLLKIQKNKKLLPKEKAEDIADQLVTIEITKKRLANAMARGKPVMTFRVQDGEAFAGSDTPPESFYELTSTNKLPLLTAIKIQVSPMDPEKARISPEDGFIVAEVRASVVSPEGRKERLPFRTFLHDSEADLEDAATPAPATKKRVKEKDVADGFSANPKLFRTHWIVGVFSEPLALAQNARLEIALKQLGQIDSRPAIVRRVRLALSSDPRWTALGRDPERTAALARLKYLERELGKMRAVEVPVMSEEQSYERRVTREFERGNFLTKIGGDLKPDVPAIFPKLPDGEPRDRLTFARWFFSPGQPLTARVAVNRYWEQLFGTGIVETLENFGSVGEEPSHPELLDWLALHFQNDLHWDMKALLRELVTSAAYRQSSKTPGTLLERDPRNRLLARGPQQRLTAEMVRDQALVASGLLNGKMGGPPVMPPQPAGVWNSVYNREKWKDATGSDRYRRAVYTFVKRTSGYPSFLIFDAADRSNSLARRIATNTPLQALVTLNDPVYDEAAESLASRTLREAPREVGRSLLDARIAFEARLVLSRDPTARELAALRGLFEKTVAARQPVLKPASLRLHEGRESGPTAASSTLDGLKAVSSALLNLDAAMSR